MKITNVEPIILYAQDDSYEGEANVGGYTGYQLVVRVDTDEGIHGWGEACVGSENGEAAFAVKELIERGIAPRVKGENPIEFRKIWERLYEATYWYGLRGLSTFALSGIDTALVDIAGKALGVRACQLLGGQYRTEVPIYASLLFDMDDPEGTAKVSLTFSPSGRVTAARVVAGPFQGTRTGGCIASAFRGISVPEFSGDPVTVTKEVVLR